MSEYRQRLASELLKVAAGILDGSITPQSMEVGTQYYPDVLYFTPLGSELSRFVAVANARRRLTYATYRK